MQFELDEERALLKSSTREFLEKESPLDEARNVMEDSPEGYSKALYAQLGELGYLSLLLPEEQGGMGPLAFATVLSEMGRTAFPGPVLDLLLAVKALARCESDEAAALCDTTAKGETLVVFARAEAAGPATGEKPLETRFENDRVIGTKLFVPFGAQADALLVETTAGLALARRPDAGWSATPLPTLDHAQRFVEIALDAPATLVADPASTEAILAEVDRLAALGASAIMLGLMERMLETTVSYTMERQAFGAPIATFQALQHRCADMLLQTESTRSAVFRAAWASECEPDEAPYLSAVAKAWAGPAGRFVCGEAIQLHGGVGFTWEYDPHIYLKRVHTLEHFYGSTRTQLETALQEKL
jgi:alkylation response protein AidB-like acyl-CoA dehydrogenase